MEEEKYIEERVGKRNPFRVPDGYFNHLTEQLMATIPERKSKIKPIWMRPVFYAAASICALLICGGAWLVSPDKSRQDTAQVVIVEQDPVDTAFDEAADYMMVDNHDIYAYLADY